MGGHIVGAFGGVDVAAAIFGDEFGEKMVEVAQHVGVGVFLDDQTRGGMAHKDHTEAGDNAGISHDAFHLAGDVVEGFTLGLDGEDLLMDEGGGLGGHGI